MIIHLKAFYARSGIGYIFGCDDVGMFDHEQNNVALIILLRVLICWSRKGIYSSKNTFIINDAMRW
jgi:hypothetical protein